MAQRTSQGVKDGGSALPSGTAQPALPRAEALRRCNPDQRAPSPALAKEDILYATRPKPPAQLIRATRSLDATYLKQREGGRIVSVAAIIAVAANTDGRREIVGLHIGPSEAETFWSGFLKSLTRRGLHGVKLVISDAHEGLKAAIRRVFGAAWQRCRVHWMRNALAYVPKTQQSMVAAALRQAFLQPDRAQASAMLRHVADQLRQKWPKLAAFIDDSETDVLSYLDFPEQHRSKLHSTNPLERLNKEVKRRADVVGIFPNEAAIVRLIGAVLLEQNDEWQLQHRYMQVEAMAELAAAGGAVDTRQIPCAA